MSVIIGQKARLEINRGTTAVPVWKKVANETTHDISSTKDKIEVLNKDTGKHKGYLFTYLDDTFTVTAQDDTLPGSNLGYAEIFTLQRLNHSDTAGGILEMRISSLEVGQQVLTFKGAIESLSSPRAVNGLVEYTFQVQVVTEPVASLQA